MDLHAYMREVAGSYSVASPLSSPTQRLLRGVATHLEHLAPGGYWIVGSGGKGQPTHTPWFGFFDPDETSSPERGLYVCYLFARDLTTASVTIMQGITALTKSLGRRKARERLAIDSAAIRAELGDELGGLSELLDLKDDGFRQRAYQASCVVAKTYQIPNLPGREKLNEDLQRFLALHQLAISAKRQLLLTRPGLISTPGPRPRDGDQGLAGFKPKDDADYRANITGGTVTRTRRHETMVREYSGWLQQRDFAVSTPHPCDAFATRCGKGYLIEVKVVRGAASRRRCVPPSGNYLLIAISSTENPLTCG